MGMGTQLYHTAHMVRALPEDGNRFEEVYGEMLVTPAPTVWHEVVQRRLLVALDQYLGTKAIGARGPDLAPRRGGRGILTPAVGAVPASLT